MPGRNPSLKKRSSVGRIHVLGVGAFGRAVAARLHDTLGVVAVSEPDATGNIWSAGWPNADLHILAAWREAPTLMRSLDQAAFAWRVPWLSVVYDHPYLRVGPTVMPGAGPCYACFRGRLAQHSTMSDLVDALHSHYDAHPDAGIRGFLPFHVTVASAITRAAVEAVRSRTPGEPGTVRQINVDTMRLVQGRVVGVHGCERCGSARESRERSIGQLEKDFIQLVSDGVGRHGHD
jgi:bacteriocin biosynthesis cyclodehydratase domain-containing protein